MLIPFPFAFLTGAVAFDVIGWLTSRDALWTTGGHLAAAGILAALAAAVPGIVDYFYTVPPKSSGKQRATKHGALNLSAVALFAIAWWMRGSAGVRPGLGLLALEILGLAALMMGAYMGGTLVTRNLISVDHRYAQAGKWRDTSIELTPKQRVATVAKRDELKTDQMKLLRLGDRRIVLGRTADGYVAFDDHCTHRGGSLAGGVMVCGTVQCLWHGSQFDVTTGAVKCGPARKAIAVYRVAEEDGEVRLYL
jgi:nitrite reductase/ring-hydroxylating ferredoxin subunit/uncharacterized membrane protein